MDYDEEGTRIDCVEKGVFEINVEELDEKLLNEAFDDVSGESLNPLKVAESRKEEIEFMQTRGIWTVVPTSLSWSLTGVGPTSG